MKIFGFCYTLFFLVKPYDIRILVTFFQTVATLLILVRLGRVAACWKAMSLKRTKMGSICKKHILEVFGAHFPDHNRSGKRGIFSSKIKAKITQFGDLFRSPPNHVFRISTSFLNVSDP